MMMHITLALLFGIVLLGLAPTGQGKCPDYWQNMNGKCFTVRANRESWLTARDNCIFLGGDLAIISDETTTKDLMERFSESGVTRDHWIGLKTKRQPYVFKWVDGETPEEKGYVNWEPGAPNGGTSVQRKECGKFLPPSGTWQDDVCGRKLPYICETDA